MDDVNKNNSKILTEKLALAREVDTLKPEVEFLRVQAGTNKELLSDKLGLQRQVTTLQVELENAQRTAQRAMSKAGKNHDQSELDLQLDEMQKKLREAKLACREAEQDADQLRHELDVEKRAAQRTNKQAKTDGHFAGLAERAEELETRLNKEKSNRQKAQKEVDRLAAQLEAAHETLQKQSESDESGEKDSKIKAQLAEVRKELAAEKRRWAAELSAAKDALEKQKSSLNDEKASEFKTQLEETKRELSAEKRSRQKAESALQKDQASWEAQKSLLDEKLNQFRNKLRSTKDQLRETEGELEKAQSAAAAKPTTAKVAVTEAPAKKSRKRAAPKLGADNIGTPGDEPPAKRGKRATGSLNRSMPGEKSTFSITPFLNRTMIAPETPEVPKEAPDADATQEKDAEPAEQTPSAAPTMLSKPSLPPPNETRKQPLAQAASRKHNAKASRKSAKAPSLEKVTEEAEASDEDAAPPPPPPPAAEPATKPEAPAAAAAAAEKPRLKKPLAKPRKSILDFQSYTADEAAAPEKRKKRKLGGAAKTLFDEEDEADRRPAKPIPGRGMFGAKGRALLGGGAKKGAAMMATNDGFQFSPLKRDRRAASVNATTFVQ
jgi:hypothetical protein